MTPEDTASKLEPLEIVHSKPASDAADQSEVETGSVAATTGGDTTDDDKGESRGESTGDNKDVEYGGPKGPEPTRYGDWERKGRCVDF